MKKVLFAFASAALVGLMGLTSCKSDEPAGLKLDQTSAELYVEETLTVTASGAAQVEWSVADEGIISIAPDGLKVVVTALKKGETTLVAQDGNQQATCVITVLKEVEPQPEVEAPAPGSVTVVVCVPENSVDCGGCGVVGGKFIHTSEWNPADALPMEKVEGTNTWYKATLTASEGNTVDLIECKVVGFSENKADTGWGNQWGKGDAVELRSTDVATLDVSSGEPQLKAMTDGAVVYLVIDSWQTAPCVAKNPAGTATFVLTANNLPAEATAIQITGNFPAESDYTAWAPGSGLPMTKQDDGTWTASCDVPAAFQYKYLWSADGTVWDWDHAQESFDNIQMALDLNAVDTVEAWKGGAAPEDVVE